MRLLDVARASLDELQGDYFNFLLRRKTDVWAIGNPQREAIWKMGLDKPNYSNSLYHDAAIHILAQKGKFDPWIENESLDVSANAMLVLCVRLNRMLQRQIEAILEHFKENGGFSENMTAERLDARRKQAAASAAPLCPKCGKSMLKRMQKRGERQGQEFWGCSDYPRCNGARRI